MARPRRKLRIVFVGTDDDRQSPQIETLRDGLTGEGHDVFAIRPGIASRRAARPDVVVVGDAGCLDVQLTRLRWGRSLVVLLRPDLPADQNWPHRPGHHRGRRALRDRLDRAALRRADIVVETRLQPRSPEPTGDHKTVVVRIGAGAAWFAAAAAHRARPAAAYDHGPLRVVHFSGYATPQHTATIGETIRQLAGDYVEWTMVSTEEDRRRIETMTEGRGKVTWIDPASLDDLPSLVAEHDVALGRFDTAPEFPHEVLQAAAAGCAIVTAATTPVVQALGDAGIVLAPGHPGTLAATLAALAVDSDQLARCRDAAGRRAGEAFTPAVVVAPLAARLADSPDVPF